MRDPKERFKEKVEVEPNSGCWHWTASMSNTGFGIFSLNSMNLPAARASYQLFKGDLSKNDIVVSSCANKGCVNPDHLHTRPKILLKEDRHKLFVEKVKLMDSGCHEWQASLNRGYGSFFDGEITTGAHRYSYEYYTGNKIPEGLFACHKCDNPKCVNPEHIFIGTLQDNVDDCVSKDRTKRGRPQRGWKLTETVVKVVLEALEEGHSQYRIARYFNVSRTLIYKIKTGKIWKLVCRN